MSSTTITLTRDHAYVLGCVGLFHVVNTILAQFVNAARSKYQIKVPSLYATHGMFIGQDGKVDIAKWEANGVEFNKRQRGHQHLTETLPDAYAQLLVCGVFYPLYAAQWGVLWAIGSLAYGIGYGIKPAYRLPGEALYIPAHFAWVYGIYCAAKAVYFGTPL